MANPSEREDPSTQQDSLKYVVSGPSPYTVEAEIEMMGRVASGARAHRGWRGRVARVVVLAVLVAIVASAVLGTVDLLTG